MKLNGEENKKRKRPIKEYAILILVAIIGFLIMVISQLVHLEGFGKELLFSIGIEFVAGSLVVLFTSIFVENRSDEEHSEIDKRLSNLARMVDSLDKDIALQAEVMGKIGIIVSDLKRETEESFATKYSLMNIQNKCLRRRCTTQKVSDYIINSKELDLRPDSYEYHILSNQLHHYDFTTLSSLAIATNIQKNNEYVYYYPDDHSETFERLRDQIRHFLCCDNMFGSKVAEWVRYCWAEKYAPVARMKELKSVWETNPGSILNGFDKQTKANLSECVKTLINEIHLDRGIPCDVCNWVNVNKSSDVNTTNVLRFVKKVKRVLDEFERSGLDYRNVPALTPFADVVEMYILCEQLESLESGEGLDEDLVNKYMDDSTPGSESLLKWINGGPIQDYENILNNNLIGINLGSAPSVELCYNFCIVVPTGNGNGSVLDNHVSIAWYTCHNDISVLDDTVDSNITVYSSEKNHEDAEIKSQLVNVFVEIINSTPSARTRLERFQSELFKYAERR